MNQTPAPSPVTRADCKITTYEVGPLCVDVRFASKARLDDLIQALSMLRDGSDFDHVHLQDEVGTGRQSSASTEIVFHLPGSCFDSDRADMVAHAERRIESSARK